MQSLVRTRSIENDTSFRWHLAVFLIPPDRCAFCTMHPLRPLCVRVTPPTGGSAELCRRSLLPEADATFIRRRCIQA